MCDDIQLFDIVTMSSQITRWSDYVVEDGIAYADGTRLAPAKSIAGLPSHLARVGGRLSESSSDRGAVDVSALLSFYKSFGLLAPTDRPRLFVTSRGRLMMRPTAGESIAWALRHASNVMLIMRLHRARGKELDDLLKALSRPRALKSGATPPDRTLGVPLPRETMGVTRFKPERRRDEPALNFSRRVIDGLLTPNLAHVRRIYDAREGNPSFAFECLIDVVYWQLADALAGGDLRQCPCGSLFFAQDARQRVCPPLPPRRESVCGVRFRTRKWRTSKE